MTDPVPTRPATSARNDVHADIAAYNDIARALDAIIHAPVMRHDGIAHGFPMGSEDRRYIAAARSVLVDAEVALLRVDHPEECADLLDAARAQLRWIVGGRKRQRYTAPVRGLDTRTAEAIRDVVNWISTLIPNLYHAASQRPLSEP